MNEYEEGLAELREGFDQSFERRKQEARRKDERKRAIVENILACFAGVAFLGGCATIATLFELGRWTEVITYSVIVVLACALIAVALARVSGRIKRRLDD
jgi:cation transporter-like permease